MQSFLIPIFCLLAGAVIAWIIRKLIFEKNCVPLQELNHVKEEMQALKTDKAVVDKSYDSVKADKEHLAQITDSRDKEINALKSELARKNSDCENLEANLSQAKVQLQETKSELQLKNKESNEAIEVNCKLTAQLESSQDKLATQKADLESIGNKFEDSFKVLAQNILESKSKSFSVEQEKNMKAILEPLQKEIQQFRDNVVVNQKQESDERISLREQVKGMTVLNQTLSEQANRLTETLRLQVKQQGDWGESILEAILENSGLQKDLQYFTQQSSKNDDGKTIRPDVLIKYPDERTVIIDSKVSLVHYYNMCSEMGEEGQKVCLKQLIQSIKAHIDGLDAKNYQHITQALDFIVMFVPVEPAYIAAMHGDSGLWQYAYKKGIFLISPANLIATLKLVKDMWRRDAVDRNAQNIADKAGKLYDKLVGFVESFEKVGTQLEKAKETWGDAQKQLTAGKGNLISIGLKMKNLHINSKKDIGDDLANQAILNDHFAVRGNDAEGIVLYE